MARLVLGQNALVDQLGRLAHAIKAGQSVKSIERSPWLKDLRGDERYKRMRQ